jgi:hypothetical protein
VHNTSTEQRQLRGQPFNKMNADDHDLTISDRESLFITH